MIAVDTNVLVRFLVEDDEDQSARAAVVFASAAGRDREVFISDLVLAETVWVLRRCYAFERAEIANVLQQLLRSRQLAFSNTDRLAYCISAFGSGKADFADYLIGRLAEARGAPRSTRLTSCCWRKKASKRRDGRSS